MKDQNDAGQNRSHGRMERMKSYKNTNQFTNQFVAFKETKGASEHRVC